MEKITIESLPLFEKLEAFGKTNIELIKLKSVDTISMVSGSIFSAFIVGVFMVLFLVTLDVAIACWIGNLLGKLYLGFFIIALTNLILAGIAYLMKNFLKVQFANSFIAQILNPSICSK